MASSPDNKALIRASFTQVVEPMHYDEQAVRTYFAPDYRQAVDGQTLDFAGFCQHMRTQKAALKALHVQFTRMVAEGDVVFTNHTVTLETKEGRAATIKVLAEFIVRDGQIVACDELTRLVSGDDQERDLGSRR
jgi:predicted SnoaL-like aldol condensation-catalyzing enzyme